MKLVITAAVLGASALAFTATTASAEIVCNDVGDCWQVKERYNYSPELHLRIHPDSWRWKDAETRYRWREHEGRGYWRGGVWVDL